MARNRNTNTRGGSFSQTEINQVWEKGIIVQGQDPAVYRKDKCGAWIKKSDYGNINSKYGWEIDHDKPVAKDGGDEMTNLFPLHWENNRGKSDDYPKWYCTIS